MAISSKRIPVAQGGVSGGKGIGGTPGVPQPPSVDERIPDGTPSGRRWTLNDCAVGFFGFCRRPAGATYPDWIEPNVVEATVSPRPVRLVDRMYSAVHADACHYQISPGMAINGDGTVSPLFHNWPDTVGQAQSVLSLTKFHPRGYLIRRERQATPTVGPGLLAGMFVYQAPPSIELTVSSWYNWCGIPV